MRVLEKQLVYILARGVGRGALGDRVLTVFVGIDVRGTAGEKDGLAGVDQVRDRDRGGAEWDLDGLAAAAFHGYGVLRPGALVVGEIGAGGLRDRDARTGMRHRVHQG
jgi:hypothetical protein